MLTGNATIEVHFYQQNEVAFFLETNIPDQEQEKFSEVLCFCCLAIRQMSNLNSPQMSASIGAILGSASSDIALFAEAASQPNPNLAIVDYRGTPGRKRFALNLQISGTAVNFSLSAKGFGIFASGMGYYAPASVTSTLAFLAKRRSNDQFYLKVLKELAGMFSVPSNLARIGMSGQAELAMQFALSAFAAARNSSEAINS